MHPNEYDEFAADHEGASLDEIERWWNTPADPFACDSLECSLEHPGALSNLPHDA